MVEIGFGKVGQVRKAQRLLNKDGSFNVEKYGLSALEQLSVYQTLMTMRWPRFLCTLIAIYLVANLFFALLYFFGGADGLEGMVVHSAWEYFLACFFFSVQTFATIGYGVIHPVTLLANVLVTVESFVGLLLVALLTGLLFARFSRPQACILFSTQALFAPYRGAMSFQFRMTSTRKSAILEPAVRVVFSKLLGEPGKESREYYTLPLLVSQVMFMPLYWTITHLIDEKSPLFGATPETLRQCEGEFLILFSGIDELFSESIYTRHSYRYDEIAHNVKFVSLYVSTPSGKPAIDVTRLSAYEAAPAIQAAPPGEVREERRV